MNAPRLVAAEDLDLLPLDTLLGAIARRVQFAVFVYRCSAKQPGYVLRRVYWRGEDPDVLRGLCNFAEQRIAQATDAEPVADNVIEREELG